MNEYTLNKERMVRFLGWHCIDFQRYTHAHTHAHLMPLFPGLPGFASARKVKPIWILPKQETVSGSGISWAICKSTPCSRQITMPTTHHSVFYRPDALLPPNQQRQSTEGMIFRGIRYFINICYMLA